MVRYLTGWSTHYALCTRLTIQIPDQYIRKQDGLHFSGIQTPNHLASASFWLFEYQTNLFGIHIPACFTSAWVNYNYLSEET